MATSLPDVIPMGGTQYTSEHRVLERIRDAEEKLKQANSATETSLAEAKQELQATKESLEEARKAWESGRAMYRECVKLDDQIRALHVFSNRLIARAGKRTPDCLEASDPEADDSIGELQPLEELSDIPTAAENGEGVASTDESEDAQPAANATDGMVEIHRDAAGVYSISRADIEYVKREKTLRKAAVPVFKALKLDPSKILSQLDPLKIAAGIRFLKQYRTEPVEGLRPGLGAAGSLIRVKHKTGIQPRKVATPSIEDRNAPTTIGTADGKVYVLAAREFAIFKRQRIMGRAVGILFLAMKFDINGRMPDNARKYTAAHLTDWSAEKVNIAIAFIEKYRHPNWIGDPRSCFEKIARGRRFRAKLNAGHNADNKTTQADPTRKRKSPDSNTRETPEQSSSVTMGRPEKRPKVPPIQVDDEPEEEEDEDDADLDGIDLDELLGKENNDQLPKDK